ncbi:conserved hypothetical protein [Vibrio phage 409E50-1]|nr:conserved hypothetical protein [Vibrio phage 521E56-1]CAH9012881.1 conserved hypothetical protein [Vibrio phage 384E50-1]CAH9012912.1 conserved hypothetical protein [Vibrio phage 409E50-1]CAH9012941.1 conserved hypothetical protein [Vibrio phage 402E50-1]CAH9013737.1 conserved hypothetical protein [Vibrio phage 405E50-1]CAH9013791.1 conserved hypothetical protein [Vibrio phage 413E50-1]
MSKFTKSAIAQRISKFHKAAAITDSEFSDVCKDLLTYVYDDFRDENKCNDVSSINDFIKGLKPSYKKVAVQFFPKLIGWDWDSTEEFFGKKHAKKKNYDTKKAKAKEFHDSDSTVWDWFEANGKKAEKKAPDYKKSVANALDKAFKAKDADGNDAFTMKDLINVMRAQDIDMRQLMELAELAAKFEEA